MIEGRPACFINTELVFTYFCVCWRLDRVSQGSLWDMFWDCWNGKYLAIFLFSLFFQSLEAVLLAKISSGGNSSSSSI